MRLKYENIIFIGLLFTHFIILLLLIDDYSISYDESLIYFESSGFISSLINISTTLFGQNDIALRLPFVLFYIGSGILLYLITKDYFKSRWDRLISLSIFLILPGVYSAALLVNSSIIVIFATLLYLYLYKRQEKEYYFLLVLYLFIDNSFAILFLALFFYSLKKKDNLLLVVTLVLFGISMSMYGFEISGKPMGYLFDTFGMYSSIFSPIIFIYFFYALYRVGLKHEKDMFWYLAVTSLGLSLIFSLRQRIDVEDFAPFVVIAIPIMVKLFLHSLRIRLKEFRGTHYFIAWFGLSILVINFLIFAFNKSLYHVLEKPKSHFAYKYHTVKELSIKLKLLGINNISSNDKELLNRLKFYGIGSKGKYYVTLSKGELVDKSITINYLGKDIVSYYILDL